MAGLIIFATVAVIVGLTLAASGAKAEPSDWMRIDRIGCNPGPNGGCWIYTDTTVSQGSCTGKKIHWNGSDNGGRNTLSLLLAAHLAGKEVRVGLKCNNSLLSFYWADIK